MNDNNLEKKNLIDVSEPVNQSIMKGLVTGGLYLPLTLQKYRRIAKEEFDKLGITDNFIFIIFCLFGFGAYLTLIGVCCGWTEAGQTSVRTMSGVERISVYKANALVYLEPIGFLLTFFAAPVMCLFCAVKMENTIRELAKENGIENYQVNKFFLSVFHIYYVNYCLDEIKKLKK